MLMWLTHCVLEDSFHDFAFEFLWFREACGLSCRTACVFHLQLSDSCRPCLLVKYWSGRHLLEPTIFNEWLFDRFVRYTNLDGKQALAWHMFSWIRAVHGAPVVAWPRVDTGLVRSAHHSDLPGCHKVLSLNPADSPGEFYMKTLSAVKYFMIYNLLYIQLVCRSL